MSETNYKTISWGEVKADVYAGENCDQHEPISKCIAKVIWIPRGQWMRLASIRSVGPLVQKSLLKCLVALTVIWMPSSQMTKANVSVVLTGKIGLKNSTHNHNKH